MEAELTGALKETSNTDNSVVAEEANFDEAITAEANASNETENDFKDEQKNKYYEETMNTDIENINTIEKRKNWIKNNGGQSTKLYKQFFLWELTFFRMIV